MGIAIRTVRSPADLHAVYRFRYEVYVEEMGRPQAYADHHLRRIEEPLDRAATIVAAFAQEGVVGTVRLNLANYSELGYYEDLYGMADVVGRHHPRATSITTKFMVARSHRKSTLSARLAVAIYREAVAAGVEYDFIDCNPHLEEYFERLGYRRYRERVRHHEYGEVMPMVLELRNLAHLERVGSPFARALREVGHDPGWTPSGERKARHEHSDIVLPAC